MAEEDERRREEFRAKAPELRRALASELTALLADASTLSTGENAVLRHLIEHAGFALSGHLFLPALAVLWGEELSYVPAVRLPPADVRRSVAVLRRRGILTAGATGGVVVDPAALRLACVPPPAPKPAKRKAKPKPKPRPKARPKARPKRRR